MRTSEAIDGGRPAPLLEARGITKRFGAITALDGVDLRFFPGEVLGVVGDNGAGKTTLMKVLSGLHAPTEGEILFDSRTVVLNSPRDAQNIGIEMVYQDLALAGNLPIHDNIYLGREPGRSVLGFTIVDEKLSRKMAMEHLDRLNITVKSVDQSVEELSGGQAEPPQPWLHPPGARGLSVTLGRSRSLPVTENLDVAARDDESTLHARLGLAGTRR